MDDYLAKPVKGVILQDMLLKWAREGERESRVLEFPKMHNSDYDSICGHSSSGSVGNLSDFASSANHNVGPAGDTTGTRKDLKRDDLAERVHRLRNEKLLAASELKPSQFHISMPSPKPYMRPDAPTTPLTMEIMARLNREHEVNPFDFTFACASEDQHGESSAAASRNRSPQSMNDGANESPFTPARGGVNTRARWRQIGEA